MFREDRGSTSSRQQSILSITVRGCIVPADQQYQ